MNNPILQMLNGAGNQPTNQQVPNNPAQLMSEFNKFAKTMTPKKAQDIIMQKVMSGAISQEQFTALQQQAKQFMSFIGK